MIPTRKRRFPPHNRRQPYPIASTTDHVGRIYGHFEARKSPQGHWLVYGKCIGFDDGRRGWCAVVIKICAYVAVGQDIFGDRKRSAGFRTLAEASDFARYMEAHQ